MANGKDDIRVALGMPRHPKTLQLIEEAGERAAWALVALWCFAGENRPDGVLRSPREVEVASGWRGKRGALHAALVSCGWLEADGVTLHDWSVEQPWIANRPARVEAARANGAAGGRTKAANRHRSATETATSPPSEPPSGSVADAIADRYRNPSGPLPPSPSPSPTPSPTPTPTPLPVPVPTRARPPEPEPRASPPPPDTDPDDGPTERRLRGTAVVAGLLASQSGATPAFAGAIAAEAVERVEGDHAFLAAHLTANPLARGADLPTWKHRAAKAWVEQRDAARLEASDAANARRLAAVAEQDRLRAEFAASGYTDAAAWRVDRKAGHLRTGEAAARRRWDITRGAYDVEETTRVVGCPTSSSARGLTCRRPRSTHAASLGDALGARGEPS